MNRENWGVKRICLECNVRFYDFNKLPIVCPACSAVFDPEYLLKRKTKNMHGKNAEIEPEDAPEGDDIIVSIEEAGDDISLDDAKD